MRTFRVADLFCGAGGTSSGARRAIQTLGAELDLVAVNHWPVAIATHSRNHPGARHHCVDLDAARPEQIVPEGALDLLMASPECVFFSRARGGRPIHDQARMSAWHVQRWASALDVRCILVENVPEFRDWGPLLANGHPDRTKKGLYFQAWVQALLAMGYEVSWRLLNAADYGDATTRTRFFLQARKDGLPIRWPEPTHRQAGTGSMFGSLPRWRAARDVIDWSNPGRSLFERKAPLSLKTRLRIARGLRKFGGPLAPLYIRLLDLPEREAAADAAAPASPFIAVGRENNVPKAVDEPLGTITTIHATYLVVPTLTLANRNNNVPRSVGDPIPSLTSAGGGGVFLVEPTAEPFVLGQQSGSVAREASEPLPTIATDGAISLIQPLLAPYYGTGVAASVEEPLGTVTTKARFGLCSPLVVPYGPRAEARDSAEPLPTVLTHDRLGVCIPTAEPFIVPQFGERAGQEPRVHDVGEPLPAVTSHGAGALVQPLIVPPGREVDPRRLVLLDGQLYLLDIRFRMLTNRELARAMGFDDAEVQYEFSGTLRDVTKQIGNAVAVHLAAALVGAILGESERVEAAPARLEVVA